MIFAKQLRQKLWPQGVLYGSVRREEQKGQKKSGSKVDKYSGWVSFRVCQNEGW